MLDLVTEIFFFQGTVSEQAYFKIEMKLRLIYENFDHRVDFLTFRIRPSELRNDQQKLKQKADLIRKRA